MRDTKNYVYGHSAVLNMEIAVARDGSHMWTEDKVKYTREELELIKQPTLETHLYKKTFRGKIVDNEPSRV